MTGETYSSGTVVTLTATADTGSTFAGWSGACSGTNPTVQVTMNSDNTCTATFTANPPPPSQYTLTVNTSGTGSGTVTSNPPGISCGSDCSETYTAGTAVTLTATPAAGSTFAGWSEDCDTNGQVTMNSAKTCTATFTANQPVPTYTLTVNAHDFCDETTRAGRVYSSDGVIDCGTDCTETRTGKFSIELIAEPADGYTFMGWSGSAAPCGSSTHCTVSVYGGIVATAEFAKVLPLPGSGVMQEIQPALFYSTCTQPIGVGLASKGNSWVDLNIWLPGFAQAMDLYLGVYLPDIDNRLYAVRSNGDLVEFSGINASNVWKSNVTKGFWSKPLYKWYSDALMSFGIYVPVGRYEFYLLAVPAETTGVPSNYYLWHTTAVVR